VETKKDVSRAMLVSEKRRRGWARERAPDGVGWWVVLGDGVEEGTGRRERRREANCGV
jgi:hypothetical protein